MIFLQGDPQKTDRVLSLFASASLQDIPPLGRVPSLARSDTLKHSSTSIPAPEYVLEGLSLGLFTFTNPVRVWAFNLVTNRMFDWGMVCIIALNCVALAAENPGIVAGSSEDLVLYYADIIFTGIFTIEV